MICAVASGEVVTREARNAKRIIFTEFPEGFQSMPSYIKMLMPVKFSHAPDFMHESGRAMLFPAESDGRWLLCGQEPRLRERK